VLNNCKAVLTSLALVGLLAACGPEGTSATDEASPTIGRSTSKPATSTPPKSKDKPANQGRVPVCEQLTKEQVSAALGANFVIGSQSEKNACYYVVEGVGQFILAYDYNDEHGYYKLKKEQIGKESYIHAAPEVAEGVISDQGPNGATYYMRDGENTIFASDILLTKAGKVTKKDLYALLRRLPDELS
jgi:hypothetical protein